jgi:hypothetical protein
MIPVKSRPNSTRWPNTRARRAIIEAFAERPPRVVEGEYEVIAERDIRVKSLPDKEEEPSS